ncbi:MAG TPA: PIG-L family deacetylase [Clostridia bacterium]|nr:PIG-L family deacetylase [Clostridia bacterium]
MSATEPLPQDSGDAGLRQMLLRLSTTGRLLHITAHPDDEDGGMLTLESRGKGVTAMLLTLNRGEGGQNKTGSSFFDELGALRTLELLAADRYYGVEQRFTRVADFGFSKSAAETFEKWRGHDVALADIVRVIRTFRPDVIVSRFQGSTRDGHGHHEAAGILSREAFDAAGDPKRFPEQISEGLRPWQAKKLYVDNVRESEDWTVRFDTGEMSPALGMSYRQFAMQGLRHQLSQGADAWRATAGPHMTFYKLVASTLPSTTGPDGHERDLFDGIDTSVKGLASAAGPEAARVANLSRTLQQIDDLVRQASSAGDQVSAASHLLTGLKLTNELMDGVRNSAVSVGVRRELLTELATKQYQFEEAAQLALGISLRAMLDPTRGTEIVVPGETFTVRVILEPGPQSQSVRATDMRLELPDGWRWNRLASTDGNANSAVFEVSVPRDAAFTRPYYHRTDPERDTVYSLDDPEYVTLPMIPPPVRVRAVYEFAGQAAALSSTLQAQVTAADGTKELRTVAVAPPFSLTVEPAMLVVPLGSQGPVEVSVDVRSNLENVADAVLKLHAPQGWRVQPISHGVTFERRGENKRFRFYLFPESEREARFDVRATLEHQGRDYEQGYTVLGRADIGTAYYYHPAVQRVSIVDVKLPKYLQVGYVMGAGDGIPEVLRQVGMDVKMISPQELAGGDLHKYGTIVLGVRAYDTRDDVRRNNKRLLDYVANGGTLVVQYNSGVADFNGGNFTPYPAKLGRDRVTVEEAPMELLDPGDDVFDFPNELTQRDFQGWVQERGLYFMSEWDERLHPLLASHDPGEQPLQGGLLRASYGHGTYIYTGLSFFRQLPSGVPGAVRLFVNLMSAGHESGR